MEEINGSMEDLPESMFLVLSMSGGAEVLWHLFVNGAVPGGAQTMRMSLLVWPFLSYTSLELAT